MFKINQYAKVISYHALNQNRVSLHLLDML